MAAKIKEKARLETLKSTAAYPRITLLIPATYGLNPTGAIIMLAGIYYGAMYGGSTTSILMNIPGESASVITCLEGYQMTLKGRAATTRPIALAMSTAKNRKP